MIKVALFSEQPLLAVGLEAAFAGSDTLSLSGFCQSVDDLWADMRAEQPDVLLIELTDSLSLPQLGECVLKFPWTSERCGEENSPVRRGTIGGRPR